VIRRWPALAVLVLGLAASIGLGLAFGSAEDPSALILYEIRLPRVLLAALVGSGLATSGALLQPLLRNPLADPYLLGISGGAALGAVLALVVGDALGFAAWLGSLSVPGSAFLGALVATAALYGMTSVRGRTAPGHSLLLCGVVFNAFASALILFLLTAVELDQVAGAFLWLIGSIRPTEVWVLVSVGVLLAIALGVGLHDAHALNLMTQGNEVAQQLGVDTTAVRRRILLATALMIGAAVSVSGLIGFVGLVVPHLLRLVLGADNRTLVPAAALLGAAFLVCTDALARTALAPQELPVGAFCALLGGPVFVALLRRQLALEAR